MKYLLKILGLSLLAIPFLLWEVLVSVWTFRTDGLKKQWSDIYDTLESDYRRAFPYKPNRSQKRNAL
jgi:hypothetical protein